MQTVGALAEATKDAVVNVSDATIGATKAVSEATVGATVAVVDGAVDVTKNAADLTMDVTKGAATMTMDGVTGAADLTVGTAKYGITSTAEAAQWTSEIVLSGVDKTMATFGAAGAFQQVFSFGFSIDTSDASLEKMFADIDGDKSGKISQAEMKTAIKEIYGKGLSDETISAMMAAADTDKVRVALGPAAACACALPPAAATPPAHARPASRCSAAGRRGRHHRVQDDHARQDRRQGEAQGP